MNIGFDAKRFFLNRSGLGNYSRWLIHGLINQYPQNSYHLYTPQVNKGDLAPDFTTSNSEVTIHLPSNLFKTFWRTKGIKKDLLKHSIEVFHGLSNEIPYGIEKTKIKSVVTIHDLIFKIHPEYYNPIDRSIYDTKFKSACERSNKIIAISEHTRQLIIDHYGIPKENTEVIYMDSLPIFHESADAKKLSEIKKKYSLNQPFFLNVGGGGGRKNQVRLCRAFAEIANNIDHNLLICGKKGRDFEEIEKVIKTYNLKNRIHWLENITDEDLFNIYHLSYATVFPSLYEGFGIPIVESYRCGKPVITSFGSSLEEVAGSSGLKCDPRDINDIATQMLKLTVTEVYDTLVKNIPQELLRFESGDLLKKYYTVYEEICGLKI